MSKVRFPMQPLSDLVTAIRDGTHGTHRRVTEGVPLLSAKNITANGEIAVDDTDDLIPEAEYQGLIRSFMLEPDDLLLTIVGSLGRRAIYSGQRVTFQRSVAYIRPQQRKISSRFLFHWMGHPAFSKELARRSNATAQAGLYLGELAKVSVPVPNEPEQCEIAQILDTIDTAIQETEALIDKLKAVKQGVLHDLLTRGIDANGQLRPPQSEAPQLYKESPLGWIPRQWEGRKFSALADYLNGNTFDAGAWTDSGLPIIRIQNLNGSRDFNYYAGAMQEKWHVHPGDLLFAWSGQRGVSFGARLWDGPEGVLNQHIFKVLPKENLVSKAFLYRLLRFRQVNIENAAHGFKDSFLHVTRGELGIVNAGVPSLDEQERIELRVAAYESKQLTEEAELGKLQSMKTGLMDDLLTGRVRATPLLEAAS